MKNALICFKNQTEYSFDHLQGIIDVFGKKGVWFDDIEILLKTDDLSFKRQLNALSQTMDNLILIVPEDIAFDFKNIICEECETELIESDNALEFIEPYAQSIGVKVNKDYSLIPVDSTLIPNDKGMFQGFMIEQKEFTLVVLPDCHDELMDMCDGFVLPYFENKYDLYSEKFVFKYFGNVKTLNKTLNEISDAFDGAFTYDVCESYGDCKGTIYFSKDSVGTKTDVLRLLMEKTKDNVYAEFDISLSQRLFDILKLKNKKISVAESFTGGRIVSSLINNPGASEFVMEGVVSYSNLSKVKRLKVKDTDLSTVGAVSPQVAYQMSSGLLMTNDVDIAVSTTGIAGPKSDDTKKPVGLCYIGVGMKDGVHVYKYNFSGDRESITETAKNTALFLAIKRLKNL